MHPTPDAVLKNGHPEAWSLRRPVEIDRTATAAKRMIAALESGLFRDSRVTVGDETDAEQFFERFSIAFAAFAELANAMTRDAASIGLRTGSEFSPNPYDHDVYAEVA